MPPPEPVRIEYRNYVHQQEPDDNSHHIRHYIHRQESKLSNHRETDVDELRLQQVLKDAANHSFGIVGVEVGLLDEDDGWLSRPAGGWWHCPYMSETVSPLLSSNKSEHRQEYPGVMKHQQSGGQHAISLDNNSFFNISNDHPQH
jgi:hypothetical protein